MGGAPLAQTCRIQRPPDYGVGDVNLLSIVIRFISNIVIKQWNLCLLLDGEGDEADNVIIHRVIIHAKANVCCHFSCCCREVFYAENTVTSKYLMDKYGYFEGDEVVQKDFYVWEIELDDTNKSLKALDLTGYIFID